jgi:hypothetical protein
MDTVKFVYDNRDVIHSALKGPFTLEFGCPVFNDPEKFGITKIHNKEKVLNKYDYEVNKGMTLAEKEKYCLEFAPFFESFNPLTFYMGSSREHALIVYSEKAEEFDKLKREVHLLPK